MSAGRSLSYEVYYLQHGRWHIHARFKFDQRDESVEECKRLDSQGFEGSCVVRESYSQSTGESSESVIYHSPRLTGKPAIGVITGQSSAPSSGGGGGSSGGGGGGSRAVMDAPEGSAAANAAKEAKKRREEDARQRAEREALEVMRGQPPKPKYVEVEEFDVGALLVPLMTGLLISLVMSVVFGFVAYKGLEFLATNRYIFSSVVNDVVILGSGALGFFVFFIPLVKKALKNARKKVKRRLDNDAPNPGVAQDVRAAAAEIAATANSAAAAAADIGGGGDEQRASVRRAAMQALETEKLPSFDFSAFDDDDDDDDPDDVDETGPVAAEPTKPVESKKKQEDKSANENKAVDDGPDPAVFEPALDRLVKEALSVCGAALASDHYLRFGMILFVSGAAESLGRRCKIGQSQLVAALSKRIEGLGAPAQHAMGFAANIDEYLIEQRYFEMYAKGRGAGVKVGQNLKASSGMVEAVAFWKTPKAATGSANPQAVDAQAGGAGKGDVTNDQQAGASNSFVAVMFTDIADSTHKQQTMGDEWLMNVVRAHNDICREALAVHGGREIKHTGDGIMATFPTVGGSVEAALAMQDGFKRFSTAMPDLAFRVRVGISAGEPIHESGDVFGTPVNLAARVLSKTEADEVWVSKVVHDMCQGKKFAFTEAGRFELKGFDEPQPIYKVVDRRKKPRDGAASSKAA